MPSDARSNNRAPTELLSLRVFYQTTLGLSLSRASHSLQLCL